MVDYVEIYTPLYTEIVKKLLPQIKNFSTSLSKEEWEKINLLLHHFHKDLRDKLVQLYEKELVKYCKLTKEAEDKIRKSILDEFNKKLRLPEYKNCSYFTNIANFWKNFLFMNYQEHFYLEQFNMAKGKSHIKFKSFKEFFDFVLEKNEYSINSAHLQQQEVINLINEINALFNKKLTPSKIERLSERNFNILLVFLVGLLTLGSVFGGAYFTYWLTLDDSPSLIASFEGEENGNMQVKIINQKENVATNVYPVLIDNTINPLINPENLVSPEKEFLLKKGEYTFLIPYSNVEICRNFLEKNGILLTEYDKVEILKEFILDIKCDNCEAGDIVIVNSKITLSFGCEATENGFLVTDVSLAY